MQISHFNLSDLSKKCQVSWNDEKKHFVQFFEKTTFGVALSRKILFMILGWFFVSFHTHLPGREVLFAPSKKKQREKLWKQRRVESNGEQHFLACSATCLGCERCFSWTAFPRLVFPPGTFNSFHILFGFNNFSASSSSRCSTPLFACLLLALCSPGVNFPIISFI